MSSYRFKFLESWNQYSAPFYITLILTLIIGVYLKWLCIISPSK